MPVPLANRPLEILERKAQFLEQHPPEQIAKAHQDLSEAQRQWDEYQNHHEISAKIVKSVTVLRSDHYRAAREAWQKAADNMTQLKSEMDALGLQGNERLEDIQVQLSRKQSEIEAHQVRAELLRVFTCDALLELPCLERPRLLNEAKQKIKANEVLLPPDRNQLLQEANQLFQKIEQDVFLKYELVSFCYDKLKSYDFAERKGLYEGYWQRLQCVELDSDQQAVLLMSLTEHYEQIEKRRFLEDDLKLLESTPLGLEAEYTQLTRLIEQRYAGRYDLVNDLKQAATQIYEKTKRKILRSQELEPLYQHMRSELSFGQLIRLEEQDQENRLKLLLSELGEDYSDVALEIKQYYFETKSKIELALDWMKTLLADWSQETLKKLSEDQIEEQLNLKLARIDQMNHENHEIKSYLHGQVEEIGQLAILKHRLQHFPVKLWSLDTMTERQKYAREFEADLPLIEHRNELVHEVETLYRHTEAEIQLAKMEKTLESLEKVFVDVWQENKMDVPFQEAQIDFDKLRVKNQALIASYHQLREKHALILEENRLIRQAVQEFKALKHLSFEAQERAMPWIAQQCFRMLRTEQVLNMLGVERLLPWEEGDFRVGTASFQLSPFQLLLLKDYVEEVLGLFRADPKPRNWISRQIEQEMQQNWKQLSATPDSATNTPPLAVPTTGYSPA